MKQLQTTAITSCEMDEKFSQTTIQDNKVAKTHYL